MRLLGDGSSYMQMMRQTQESSQQTAKVVQEQTTIIEKMQQSLTGFGNTAMSVLGGLGAKNFLSGVFNGYRDAETSALRLNAAIEANGQAIGDVLPRFETFATQMREQTGAGKLEVMSLLQKAESYGMTADGAMRATRAALALAATGEGSAQHFLMVGRAIEENNPHMIHHIAALRGITNPAEKLAKAQELVEKGMKLAGTVMNSTEGVMKRLEMATKGLTKQFGEVVAEALTPLVRILTQAYEKFNALDPTIKKVIVYAALIVASLVAFLPILGTIGTVFGTVIGMISGGLMMLKTVFLVLIAPITLIGSLFSGWGLLIAAVLVPVIGVIGLVSGAIFVIIRAMGGLTKAFETIKNIGVNVWNWIKDAASAAWDWIQDRIDDFVEFIQPVVDFMTSTLVAVWTWIKAAAAAAWDYIKKKVQGFISWITPAWNKAIDIVVYGWTLAKEYAGIAWDWAEEKFNQFWSWFEPIWDGAIEIITSAWDLVSETATEAWDWIEEHIGGWIEWFRPIFAAAIGIAVAHWDALSSAAEQAWTMIKEWAQIAWDFLKELWEGIKVTAAESWSYVKETALQLWQGIQSIFGDMADWIGDIFGTSGDEMGLSWEKIKDFIIEVLLRIEFGIRNLGPIAQLVWTGVKYKAVQAFDSILTFLVNFSRAFGGNIYAVGAIFGTMWHNALVAGRTTLAHLVSNVIALAAATRESLSIANPATIVQRTQAAYNQAHAASLQQLTAGIPGFQNVGNASAEAFAQGFQDMAGLVGQGGASALQNELRQEFEAQGAALMQTWEAFYARRMEEIANFQFGGIPQAQARARDRARAVGNNVGTSAGEGANAGLSKEMHKFDATLFGGAEALSRIAAYKERIAAGQSANVSVSGGFNSSSVVQVQNQGSAEGNRIVQDLLNRIAQSLDNINGNTARNVPGVEEVQL